MRLDPRIKERLVKTFADELFTQKEIVTVFSVYPLSPEDMQKILVRFPQFAISRVENKIDPTLIGGLIIQAGSQSIDLSIRNALHLLKIKLYESN